MGRFLINGALPLQLAATASKENSTLHRFAILTEQVKGRQMKGRREALTRTKWTGHDIKIIIRINISSSRTRIHPGEHGAVFKCQLLNSCVRDHYTANEMCH